MELYDLENDIGEKNNVARRYPEIVQKFEKLAKEAHIDDPNFPIQNCIPSCSQIFEDCRYPNEYIKILRKIYTN